MTLVSQNKNIADDVLLTSRKQKIAAHFAGAQDYEQHASVQQQTCQHLLTQIRKPQQHSVLEIGAGSGQLTRLLADNIRSEYWVINELAAIYEDNLKTILPEANLVIGDAETLSTDAAGLGDKHSLIISANAVQWFDNPLGLIARAYKQLSVGGQLLFNTFTPNNFMQIKALTGQGLHYPASEEWRNALDNSGFKEAELIVRRYDLYFDSPIAVLKHIKKTGVSTNQVLNNTLKNSSAKTAVAIDSTFTWNKTSLAHFINNYWQRFSKGEQVVLTYEVLIVSALK